MQSEAVLMHQIESVKEKDLDELTEQFRDLHGFDCGDTSVTHLRKRIIYRLQEIFYGGICEGDMEILDSIADKDPLANLKRLEDRNKLKVPGTRLLRVWKGRQHEVIVDTDGKFIYRGKRFRTLSAIARKITGVQWNGKQFFGVKS